jgi:hypothetical protein
MTKVATTVARGTVQMCTDFVGDEPYSAVRDLLLSLGGSMTFKPGGGPGGVWELELHGKHTAVPVRDNRVNRLDSLYVPRITNPVTWDDYGDESLLAADAFWLLIALFNGEASSLDGTCK